MGRPSKWEGLLIERLKERVRRYRVKDDSIIYVHNFDKPVWHWLNAKEDETKVINGYTLLGELLHAGLERVIEPAGERCKTVWLPRGFPRVVDRRIAERFIHWQNSNPYCIVCGSADGLIALKSGEKVPVELKTTRRSLNSLPETWLRRAKFYAWLYSKRIGYLIVLNLVTSEERDIEVKAYTDDEVERIIRRWLKEEWPQRTLYRRY